MEEARDVVPFGCVGGSAVEIRPAIEAQILESWRWVPGPGVCLEAGARTCPGRAKVGDVILLFACSHNADRHGVAEDIKVMES